MTIRKTLDKYRQEVNQCNDPKVIKDLVVYGIYDFIDNNEELRNKFYTYVERFNKIGGIKKVQDESLNFIASNFNDFLLFCAERRHISGHEKYFGKQNVIPSPCLFSNRVESVLDDPAQMRTETVQNNAILLDVYAKEKLSKIKSFASIVIRELLEAESIKVSDDKKKRIESLNLNLKVGDLTLGKDGFIRYKEDVILLRDQLIDLCILFMRRPEELITFDDIKEEIIKADRRGNTSFATIAKYVSELHSSLKACYEKKVIFNQKKEGWYFKP